MTLDPSPIRVVVVDDDPLVRSSLRFILQSDDLVIVGEAGDGAAAISLVAQTQPDVVLMDIRMPGMDGLTATEHIRAQPEPPELLILTTFDSDEHVLRALRAGAAGFILKDTEPSELLNAVHRIANGDAQLSPSVLRQVIATAVAGEHTSAVTQKLSSLTERERDIALAIGEGLTNAEIAERLYISIATVKGHITAILGKLNATNRVQIALTVHGTRHDTTR